MVTAILPPWDDVIDVKRLELAREVANAMRVVALPVLALRDRPALWLGEIGPGGGLLRSLLRFLGAIIWLFLDPSVLHQLVYLPVLLAHLLLMVRDELLDGLVLV